MDQLLVSVEEAARALGVGRDLVYELMASGGLPRVKLGRRTLIPARALAEWVERQARATGLATPTAESRETPAIAALTSESHNRRSA